MEERRAIYEHFVKHWQTEMAKDMKKNILVAKEAWAAAVKVGLDAIPLSELSKKKLTLDQFRAWYRRREQVTRQKEQEEMNPDVGSNDTWREDAVKVAMDKVEAANGWAILPLASQKKVYMMMPCILCADIYIYISLYKYCTRHHHHPVFLCNMFLLIRIISSAS